MTWYPIEVLTLITKPSAFENSAEEPIHIIKLIKGVSWDLKTDLRLA